MLRWRHIFGEFIEGSLPTLGFTLILGLILSGIGAMYVSKNFINRLRRLTTTMKVLNLGATKEFTDKVDLSELYERYHLTEELIVEDIRSDLI